MPKGFKKRSPLGFVSSLPVIALATAPEKGHVSAMYEPRLLTPLPKTWTRSLSMIATLIGAFLLLGDASLLRAQSRAPASARPAANGAQNAAADALIGTVVDVIGRPMAGVEVYIASTDRTTRTDARGMFRFSNPPVGPRVVVARELGYVPYVRELVVGSKGNDTLALLLRKFPRTLSTVQVRDQTTFATTNANIIAERLMQLRVGSGRLFTRNDILQMRPLSVAELIMGVPGIAVTRGQTEIVATSTRSGVGMMNRESGPCQLQFFLDNTPIDNEALPALDPALFRSVEVYPQVVILTGLPVRSDRCGAVVINTVRR